jgi:ribosomal protein S17E
LTNPSGKAKFPVNVNPYVEDLLMQQYEDLKRLVAEIEVDVSKAEGGNKAAGTRVRKQMQEIKKASQAVRNAILEIRSTE